MCSMNFVYLRFVLLVLCCRGVMHFWRVLLELGKHYVFSVPHWPGGKVWVVFQLGVVKERVNSMGANLT